MRLRRAPALLASVVLAGVMGVASPAPAEQVAGDGSEDLTGSGAFAVEGASGADAGDHAFRWGLKAAWMYGPAAGQLQTPAGGEPGTTSGGRPTFEELGFDDAGILAAEAMFGRDRHEVFAAAQWIRFRGDATLEETLISQGTTFAAGSQVEADLKLDFYRLGYRHRIDTGGAGDGARLVFYPSAGIALLDFDFELDGSAGAEMGRSYVKGAPDVGLRVEWPATDRLLISGDFSTSLALSKLPLILTSKLEATYTLIRRRGLTVGASAGVAYEVIRYDDRHKQEVPNNIKADFGPMIVLGIDVRY